jgi:hypothetical protein
MSGGLDEYLDHTEKIIKWEFSNEAPDDGTIKIVSQGLFEAARLAGVDLKSQQVLYCDVPRGIEHRGARLGARLGKDIEAACKTISDIWSRI